MISDEYIRELDMLPEDSRVLCAVSGGADSVCLLHYLFTNREKLKIEVFAAHYEHGVRGEESRRDAAFVEELCGKLGVECTVGHGDVPAYAEKRGISLETGARELRYEFLESTAYRLSCGKIATAHNADDNAETVLFNLTRGSGSRGLAGIPPVRGKFIRPLLGTTRREIEDYLSRNGLPHVEDSTNASDEYTRNLIRHRVKPVLEQINPSFAGNVTRASGLLRQDDECLCAMAESFIKEQFDGVSISAEALLGLHPAVSGRVLRSLCPRPLEQEHVSAALGFADSPELGSLSLPGITLRREQGRLFFSEPESIRIEDRTLSVPGWVEIPEAGLRVNAEICRYDGEINALFKSYCFKYENICGTISVTGRKPGDRLHPAGRACGKSLKALFAEQGMTQSQRDSSLVLRDGAGILAVPGIAVDERVRPAPGDKVVRLEIKKI